MKGKLLNKHNTKHSNISIYKKLICGLNDILNKEKMDIESNDNSNNLSFNKKRNKYQPRDPLYYYYQINNKTYKYICTKKCKAYITFQLLRYSLKSKSFF